MRGQAAADETFAGGGDRVTYNVDVAGAIGSFLIEVELRYQPIAFRWARNLASYDAAETRRFVSYYDEMAAGSSLVLAKDSCRSDGDGFPIVAIKQRTATGSPSWRCIRRRTMAR